MVVKFGGTAQAIAVFSDCSNLGLVAMPERIVAAFRFELLLRTAVALRRRVSFVVTCARVANWRVGSTRLCPYVVLHSMEVLTG